MIYKDLAKHSAMPRGRLASIRQAIVDPAAGLLHCGIHSAGIRRGRLELPQEQKVMLASIKMYLTIINMTLSLA